MYRSACLLIEKERNQSVNVRRSLEEIDLIRASIAERGHRSGESQVMRRVEELTFAARIAQRLFAWCGREGL